MCINTIYSIISKSPISLPVVTEKSKGAAQNSFLFFLSEKKKAIVIGWHEKHKRQVECPKGKG